MFSGWLVNLRLKISEKHIGQLIPDQVNRSLTYGLLTGG